MLTLSPAALGKLAVSDISEKLHDAVLEAKRISNFEGKRRQMQYIGKLMRKTEPGPIRAAIDAAKFGNASDTLALHRAEKWRDDLMANDDAMQRWLSEHPNTDSQQLRSLIRQARKDAAAAQAAVQAAIKAQADNDSASVPAPAQHRAYKELFQLLRQTLTVQAEAVAVTADQTDA